MGDLFCLISSSVHWRDIFHLATKGWPGSSRLPPSALPGGAQRFNFKPGRQKTQGKKGSFSFGCDQHKHRCLCGCFHYFGTCSIWSGPVGSFFFQTSWIVFWPESFMGRECARAGLLKVENFSSELKRAFFSTLAFPSLYLYLSDYCEVVFFPCSDLNNSRPPWTTNKCANTSNTGYL